MADGVRDQPRRRHRRSRRDREPRLGATDVQAVDAGKACDRHLHRHECRDYVFQLPAGTVDHRRYRGVDVVDGDGGVSDGLLHEAPEAGKRFTSRVK